jgi:hypothetical protein
MWGFGLQGRAEPSKQAYALVMLAATALLAAFTGVLALLAVVTAWFARKAFLSQAATVTILRDQLGDQQGLSKKQGPVLDRQLEELQKSLEERKQAAAELRRAQASRVFMWEERNGRSPHPRTAGFGAIAEAEERRNRSVPEPTVTVTAHVKNSSDQPIYDAEFAWYCGTALYGSPNPQPLGTIMPGDDTSKIRVLPLRADLEARVVVRFTDAAGIRWLRRPDGGLTEERQ